MLYLLALPLLIIVGVLVFLLLQPGEISVRRSLVIRCAPAAAFAQVRDLRGWPQWSPWLLHEPDAALNWSDDPGAERGWYAWSGRLIGAGRITHVSLHPTERIEQRIDFKRPFKSTGAVSWEFRATTQDGAPATEVFWTMRGRMAFLVRFMAPAMAQLIGKDFELGLARLRALLEPGAPKLDIRFCGVEQRAKTLALTLPFDGGRDEVAAAMRAGFERLAATAAEYGIEPIGPPFSVYYLADAKSGRLCCDMALPVPADAHLGELTHRRFDGGPCQVTEVQGSWDFMELAWHAALAHLRMTKAVWERSRGSVEEYVAGPDAVADEDQLVTRIWLPVKAHNG